MSLWLIEFLFWDSVTYVKRTPRISAFDFWSTKVKREVLTFDVVDIGYAVGSWRPPGMNLQAKMGKGEKNGNNDVWSKTSFEKFEHESKPPRNQPGKNELTVEMVPIAHFALLLNFCFAKKVDDGVCVKFCSFDVIEMNFFSDNLHAIQSKEWTEKIGLLPNFSQQVKYDNFSAQAFNFWWRPGWNQRFLSYQLIASLFPKKHFADAKTLLLQIFSKNEEVLTWKIFAQNTDSICPMWGWKGFWLKWKAPWRHREKSTIIKRIAGFFICKTLSVDVKTHNSITKC